MRWMLCVMLVAGTAWAGMSFEEAEARLRERQARAATQPATRPHDAAWLRQHEEAWAKAVAGIDRARQAAADRIAASDVYGKAQKRLQAASEARDTARREGLPEDLLRASAEYLAALTALDRVVADAVADDLGIAAAERSRTGAVMDLVQARRDHAQWLKQQAAEAAAKVDADPILRAIRDSQLAKRMTLEEAQRAMRREGLVVREGDGRKQIQWKIHGYARAADGSYYGVDIIWTASFAGGRIESYTRHEAFRP